MGGSGYVNYFDCDNHFIMYTLSKHNIVYLKYVQFLFVKNQLKYFKTKINQISVTIL